MAHGIQYFQTPQFIKLSSPGTGGMAALKDIKKGGTLTLNVVHVLGAGQVLIEEWRLDYNKFRPRSALKYRPLAPEARLN